MTYPRTDLPTIGKEKEPGFQSPGNPGKLPNGWRWVKLGEVCEFAYGASLTEVARRDGSVSVYGSNGVVGMHDSPLTAGPTIVIGRKGSVGAVHYSATPCFPIDTTFYIETTKLPADLQWLAYILSLLGLPELNKASGVPGLNRNDAYRLSLPLPSLAEQKRIAAILHEQMAAVARARKAAEERLAAVKALPDAAYREAFSSDQIRSWDLKTVEDIASLVTDGPHVTPTYLPDGVPFVTVTNIQTGRLDFKSISYISIEDHNRYASRAQAEPGDILYSKDGTLGIPCVVDTDRPFSFFVSVALVKLRRHLADPYFVAHVMASPFGRKQVERLGAGAGLKHMVLKSIRALRIPCPPISEQRRIAAILNEQMAMVARARKAAEEELETINTLPAALLRTAFAGEL